MTPIVLLENLMPPQQTTKRKRKRNITAKPAKNKRVTQVNTLKRVDFTDCTKIEGWDLVKTGLRFW